jgi:hypothetical protein
MPVWKALNGTCKGTETDIWRCPGMGPSWSSGMCDTEGHTDDLIIECTGNIEGDLRIVPFNTRNADSVGRLEVFHLDSWGTVCLDGFSSAAARVACRQLGYGEGQVSQTSCKTLNATGGSMCGSNIQRVWLDDVTCTGAELSLNSCPRVPWSPMDRCSHDRDVIVECSGSQDSSTLIQVSEGGLGVAVATGTGVAVTTSGGVKGLTRLQDVVGLNRTVTDRPVPIPAKDRPLHEEFVLECSVTRKQRAKSVVCVDAVEDEITFQRCIADYCLTGSETLARADIIAWQSAQDQDRMMSEEAALLHEEEVREESEIIEVARQMKIVRAKQAEQDAVMGAVLAKAGSATMATPCPP